MIAVVDVVGRTEWQGLLLFFTKIHRLVCIGEGGVERTVRGVPVGISACNMRSCIDSGRLCFFIRGLVWSGQGFLCRSGLCKGGVDRPARGRCFVTRHEAAVVYQHFVFQG